MCLGKALVDSFFSLPQRSRRSSSPLVWGNGPTPSQSPQFSPRPSAFYHFATFWILSMKAPIARVAPKVPGCRLSPPRPLGLTTHGRSSRTPGEFVLRKTIGFGQHPSWSSDHDVGVAAAGAASRPRPPDERRRRAEHQGIPDDQLPTDIPPRAEFIIHGIHAPNPFSASSLDANSSPVAATPLGAPGASTIGTDSIFNDVPPVARNSLLEFFMLRRPS